MSERGRTTCWSNFRTERLDTRTTPTAEDAKNYVPQDDLCQCLLAVCLGEGDDVPTAMVHVLAYHITRHGGKDARE